MTRPNLLVDSYGRILRDLRVSLTDRCNFRCMYCLPETEAAQNFYRGRWANLPNTDPIARRWQPRSNILTFEEIERVVRLAVDLGVQKVRLTGGEPLLRNGVEDLTARIANIPGVTDLAMTTNGFLFPQKARALREAGLQRVSFSLDSLDRDNFKRITGRDGLNEVLASIRLAQELDFHPVKVNAVIIRGINDHEIGSLAEFARASSLSFRFIEFMPLDSARAWQKELVVAGKEILERLQAHFSSAPGFDALNQHAMADATALAVTSGSRDFATAWSFSAPDHNGLEPGAEETGPVTLIPITSANPSETARRWRFSDGRGEIGIIAPVSEPFCGHCNRVRITADGKVRTCLFSVVEHDLRSRLRGGAGDGEIKNWLQDVAWQKEDRHHIGEPEFVQPERTMSCIGG